MAKKGNKTREISIASSDGGFGIFKKQSSNKTDYDFDSLAVLRQLLSKEKSRLLYVIKNQNPSSIYDLAKKLGRGFKSVSNDVKLLERIGFIDLIREKHKNRTRLKPVIAVDTLTINFRI